MKKILLLIALSLTALSAQAGGGNDHVHPEEKKPLATAAVPSQGDRQEITSPDVELLLLAERGKLSVYADRFATGEPINGAKIELESGTNKLALKPAGEGFYTGEAPWLASAGTHDLVISIEAGDLLDLLPAKLKITSPAKNSRAAFSLSTTTWSIGGALLLALMGWGFWRLRKGTKK